MALSTVHNHNHKMESNARISVRSSNGSSMTSDLSQQDFIGKELLLLLRLQTDPELFESWKANVISGDNDDDYSLAVSLTLQNKTAYRTTRRQTNSRSVKSRTG